MTTVKAGPFELTISDPYPCWIEVKYHGAAIFRFHHEELPDLKFAVARAQQLAAPKLGQRAWEVADPE